MKLSNLRFWLYTKRAQKGYFCRCGARTESIAPMLQHIQAFHGHK